MYWLKWSRRVKDICVTLSGLPIVILVEHITDKRLQIDGYSEKKS